MIPPPRGQGENADRTRPDAYRQPVRRRGENRIANGAGRAVICAAAYRSPPKGMPKGMGIMGVGPEP